MQSPRHFLFSEGTAPTRPRVGGKMPAQTSVRALADDVCLHMRFASHLKTVARRCGRCPASPSVAAGASGHDGLSRVVTGAGLRPERMRGRVLKQRS